jgi:ABC-type amino acid transport substrate-binding protein
MPRIRALAALIPVVLAACVPAQGDGLKDQIAEDPTLLQIVKKDELRIGVPQAHPAGLAPQLSTVPGSSSERVIVEGLTTAVGRWVADALEVEPRFEYLDTDGILEGIRAGELDLGFPVMPMTEGAVRSKERSYTAPYFVAHQRLLLGAQSDLDDDLSDAAGKVCVFGDERTQIPVESMGPDLIGIRANDGQACVRLVERDIVQAIAAPDLLLFELEGQLDGSRLLDTEFNTEGYGAVVQYGETGLANFFDAVLARAIDDGRWIDAWDENVAQLTVLEPTPPDLTAEEAAALFPRGLRSQ